MGVSKSYSVAMSFRLDQESVRSLLLIEDSGMSRSEALRWALRAGAERLRRKEAIYQEALSVASDQQDREEMLEIAAFMESLRAEG